jgi:DNA-binding winged helix-turn-helix (wHTH) protein/Tol biopolymer transport system component
MDQSSATDYEFEGFRLDTVQQVLLSGAGEPIALPSRAFEALRYLVERSGELVEKSALMNAVWPRAVVEENNLSQCILTLRRALGESAGERRFILTIPGRGFKFVAPVREVPHLRFDLPAGPLAQPPAGAPPRAGPRRSVLLALALLIGAAGVALWWRLASPAPVTVPAEYAALTDVADSATAPAVSPDGHLLAFIRGGGPFLSAGQIWLELLPDGEPVQLTHSSDLIFAPAFTPDGSHVAYSVTQRQPGGHWDTWVVPITGGEPALLLPNASGLSYIGAHTLLYSEFKQGLHLGIATSHDDRSQHRDVYLPAHERGMAHYSWLSPDGKSVLVVEMDESAAFRRCRLVPFDGSSSGVHVGPEGACISAAWSPDGRWMYFSVGLAGHAHLWRQAYPGGQPEQITFGPTDEETVAVAPDGRSLLTALGRDQSTLWLHDATGERILGTGNQAFAPWLSADARRAYFLVARGSGEPPELRRLDIASGRADSILSGFAIRGYDISSDETQVVFSTGHGAASQVWIAPLDHHGAPRLLARAADEAAFDQGGVVYFRSIGLHENTLHRIRADGSDERKLLAGPIAEFHAVAPDGKHVAVDLPAAGSLPSAWLAPVDGGQPVLLREGWWPSRWSRDGRHLYLEVGQGGGSERPGRTALLPLGADGLPAASTLRLADTGAVIPHPEQSLSLSADPSVYVYASDEIRRNIYRIPLH